MNAARRCALYQALQSLDPHPTTELEYQTPFELLIAVMLSAQATDVSVNKATRILFARVNTPRALLELGADGLRPYIQSIGLYRTKARNIIAACAMLLERYQCQVPAERAALESLPGVVLNTAFGQPVIAVDTHIFRVANRTGLAPGRTVREVEKALEAATPREFQR